MTAAEEQLVAELAEALDGTATGLWMGQNGPGWGRAVANALLPVVLADRRRAVAEALRHCRGVCVMGGQVREMTPAELAECEALVVDDDALEAGQ